MAESRFPHANRLRDCVHCGLCLQACPTYLELGTEADSPRGRLHLMAALNDGTYGLDATDVVEHLDRCLGCRACETACPSGVRYGELIEDARALIRREAPRSWHRRALERSIEVLFPRPRLLAALLWPARWLDRMGVLAPLRARSRWVRLLPANLAPVDVPQRLLPAGASRGRAWLFEGCVSRVLFSATNAATARIVAACGYEVVSPKTQGCCGALHLHGGEREAARSLARANVDAFASDGWIVTNAGGCGAMLREYGELLRDDPAYAERARAFSARVRDVSEVGVELDAARLAPLPPVRVAYHESCHLAHAMGVRATPREMLQRIPGVELVELEEADVCCGSAGSYNLLQPEIAERLGRRKAERIRASGAELVAVGNPGCALQIQAMLDAVGSSVQVLQPVELVERALCDGSHENGKKTY